MTLGINEDVLRLHVSIRNALNVVQEFQDQDNLRGVKTSGVDVERSSSPQIPEDFSSWAIVKLHQSVIS